MHYLGHKVVPHAQLGRNELLPVGGSLCGHRRGGRWRFLHRASRNEHPHVEPTSVSVPILRCGLRGSNWGRRTTKRWYLSNTISMLQFRTNDEDKLRLSILLKPKECQEIDLEKENYTLFGAQYTL